MGTKERRQREFNEREELFLNVALELVRSNGLLNLQMSRLAEKAEYAVGTLYLHFDSKEDLVFVRRHPDYFRVAQYTLCEVSWKATSAERRQHFLEANDPLVEIVSGIVEDARRSGDLPPGGATAQELAVGVWALCGGHQQLAHAEGLMADITITDPYRLMCRHLIALLDGFGWKPLSDPNDLGAIDALIARVQREVFNEECDVTR
ncbi:MAG: TetR/AcrR family transcriptional regulator [Panacagrimonas sp.]|nr:TetR/AcrR family transcriptional regulator [Panacagrimonas sp.]MCC2658985.1 TetR/AcrR family transcriptional regulator [Panacagrimonas sp.]